MRSPFTARIRSANEIGEELGGLPLLGRLRTPPRSLRSADRLLTLAEPMGSEAEAFQALQRNLDLARSGNSVETIMVTSAVEGEGRSTTLANLAVSFARAGWRVALVDLDLRRPALHHFFDLNGPGVTDIALSGVALKRALRAIAVAGPPGGELDVGGNGSASGSLRALLHVLPAGSLPADAGEFVASNALSKLFVALRAEADVVLVDAPPLLSATDAVTLSENVDGVVVVTRMNALRRENLTDLSGVVGHLPAKKLGFVVTAAEKEAHPRSAAYAAPGEPVPRKVFS
jgi:succinoglycan biosynthesis transport protein ExoP